ncbi:IclR family transcriptional regulator [Streptomyces sulphureus]|uniref:IclR family transcriptional regulator n=1 Tax=Streptomyces sulphureus TaxID=47758 RepID=UPI000366CE5B|nr:helix-turn-helix domain-containing protein [Streptomyces sulphureus]
MAARTPGTGSAAKAESAESGRKADGSQTLQRGLRVLQMLAETPQGLTASEIAARLDVHRSIAYRLLTTLSRSHFASRDGNRYRIGVSFFTLAEHSRPPLLDVAQPVLRALTHQLGATACLVVPEDDCAVAVAVVEPPGPGPRFSYGVGSRDPLQRGAAGLALMMGGARPESIPRAVAARVARAVEAGYVSSHDEVVAGTYAVAAPIPVPAGERPTAVNVITHRQELADGAVPHLVEAVRRIGELLRLPGS